MVSMWGTIVTKHTLKMATKEVEWEEFGKGISQVHFSINFLLDKDLVPDPLL